jgi:hypothetical protein
MPEDRCPERSRLAKPVIDALAEVYRAKDTYDTAKLNRAENVDELALILMHARQAERVATKAFGEHVKEHGCKD